MDQTELIDFEKDHQCQPVERRDSGFKFPWGTIIAFPPDRMIENRHRLRWQAFPDDSVAMIQEIRERIHFRK